MPAARFRFLDAAAVALAAATALVTLAGIGGRPATRHAPPSTPPAALDPGFLADLRALAPRLPLGVEIAVLAPPDARDRASWYWTMAAFTAPGHTWALMRDDRSPHALMLARHDAASAGRWVEVACASEWCLWAR